MTMRLNREGARPLAWVGLCIVFAVMSLNAVAAHAELVRISLTDSAAPVIVSGDGLAPLFGVAPKALRLLVVHDGATTPVPLQVDERFQDDTKRAYETLRYALHSGAGARLDPDPLLDGDDELVFMARDVNGAPAEALPPAQSQILELHLSEPVSGDDGWGYLAAWPDIPAPERAYVHYDANADVVTTDVYRVGFPAKRKATFDDLRIIGDDGAPGPDVLDRIKVRISGAVFFRGIRFRRTEQDIRATVVAYTDGPVRVIRRIGVRLRVLSFLWTKPKEEENIFYRDFFDFTTKVASPKNLDSLVKEARLRSTTDMSGAVLGWTFYSDTNPQGVRVDGEMSEAERALDRTDHTWAGLVGPTGGVMARMVALSTDGVPLPIERGLYYMDDVHAADGPEDIPGQLGHYGYDIGNILALEKGRYDISNTGYVFRGSWARARSRLLAILDSPPVVTVRAMP